MTSMKIYYQNLIKMTIKLQDLIRTHFNLMVNLFRKIKMLMMEAISSIINRNNFFLKILWIIYRAKKVIHLTKKSILKKIRFYKDLAVIYRGFNRLSNSKKLSAKI